MNSHNDFTLADMILDYHKYSEEEEKRSSIVILNLDKTNEIFQNIKENFIYEEIGLEENNAHMEKLKYIGSYTSLWLYFSTFK